MKFSEMTKEQKQYAVLGVLVGVALMVGLSQFVLAPLQTKLAGARRELDDLTDKIHRAERLIKSEETLRVNVRESTEQLNLATRKYIPDADNPLSWATQVLYEQARAAGAISAGFMLSTETRCPASRRAATASAIPAQVSPGGQPRSITSAPSAARLAAAARSASGDSAGASLISAMISISYAP